MERKDLDEGDEKIEMEMEMEGLDEPEESFTCSVGTDGALAKDESLHVALARTLSPSHAMFTTQLTLGLSVAPEVTLKKCKTVKALASPAVRPTPPTVFRAKEKELTFRKRNLVTLPRTLLPASPSILSLDLRDNLFRTFPIPILDQRGLRVLRLSGNKLRTLPPAIVLLSELEELTLSNNGLISLDKGVGSLTKLAVLELDHNWLRKCPTWLCRRLENLRRLHLNANPYLVTLPLSFVQLHLLLEFSLDWYYYLQPSVSPMLRGSQGLFYINETKLLCRHLATTRNSKCSFANFMSYFMATRAHVWQLTSYSGQRSALHVAAVRGDVAIVKELLQSGCDVNALDDAGCTPLSLAVSVNQDEVAQILLSNHLCNVHIAGNFSGGLFAQALAKKQWHLAESIVRHRGFNANYKDANGNTALHHLFVRSTNDQKIHERLCLLVIANTDCDLNPFNDNNMTPLHYAAMKSHILALRLAAEYNRSHSNSSRRFDFNLKGGRSQFAVLHFLAMYSNVETVQYCLSSTDADILARDVYDRTARDVAKNTLAERFLLKHERRVIIRALAQRGKLISAAPQQGFRSPPALQTLSQRHPQRLSDDSQNNPEANATTVLLDAADYPNAVPQSRASNGRASKQSESSVAPEGTPQHERKIIHVALHARFHHLDEQSIIPTEVHAQVLPHAASKSPQRLLATQRTPIRIHILSTNVPSLSQCRQ